MAIADTQYEEMDGLPIENGAWTSPEGNHHDPPYPLTIVGPPGYLPLLNTN